MVIPADWQPGVKLATTLENGQRVIITPPDGAKPGMSLEFNVPASKPKAEEPRPTPEPATPPVRLASDTRNARPTTHRVRSGEHLTQIARQYGLNVRDLMGWNELTTSTIHPGQRLRLTEPEGYDARAAARARAAASQPRSVTHRVRSGENLTQIARQYGVTISDIRRWNSLSGDTIRPGQRLKIERPRRGVRG